MLQLAPDFTFLNFEPSSKLRRNANLAAERLLNLAPYGSIIVAALKKKEDKFECSIDIYSSSGPFKSVASHDNPETALEDVARSLSKKLDRWKELRNLSDQVKPLCSIPSVA